MRPFAALLVAASLAIAADGWFSRLISPSPAPLPDYLLAWQDASAQPGDIE